MFGSKYWTTNKHGKWLFGLTIGTLIVSGAAAQQVAPDAFIKSVTSEVLNTVSKDREIQNGKTSKVIELVEARILPDFDFQRMTALAVGKDWRQATPDQQAVLINEFRTLLVNTYSNALTAYKNQTITYRPVKMAKDDTDVMVRTMVKQPGAQSISIDYALERRDATWKVYDVVVGGISLVTNYRNQFAQEVNNGGIDGLTKALHAKNGSKAIVVVKP